MKPIALITGATSGIGEACAKRLAQDFYLILCGRRQENLDKLKKELSVYTDVLTLNFDVRDREEVIQQIEALPENWSEIDVLINNAGNAHGLSAVHEGNLDDWDAMIDINVKGLLYVTRAIIPGMVERRSGHVINIGSLAGIESYPNGNVYNVSKFGVDAFTRGMRMDLNQHNVKVSEVKPGLVQTEFSNVRFKGDHERAEKVYEGYKPLLASDIAEIIHFVLTRPAHVNIADLLVLPAAQASSTILNRNSN